MAVCRHGEVGGSPRSGAEPHDINVELPRRAATAGDEAHADEVRKLGNMQALLENSARNAAIKHGTRRSNLNAIRQILKCRRGLLLLDGVDQGCGAEWTSQLGGAWDRDGG